MRALLALILLLCAGPAQAMNWEGHDDWMAEIDPAVAYRGAVPHAAPPAAAVAETDCRAPAPPSRANPYEQVPLRLPDCRAPAEPEVQRR